MKRFDVENDAERGAALNDEECTVAVLKGWMADFVAERQWQRFHDPKNLAASILIEAAELMEHFQWARSDELAAITRDPAKMAAIRDELADVTAFVLSFANVLQIDLASVLEHKMQKNAVKYPAGEYRGRYEKPLSNPGL